MSLRGHLHDGEAFIARLEESVAAGRWMYPETAIPQVEHLADELRAEAKRLEALAQRAEAVIQATRNRPPDPWKPIVMP